MAYRYRDITLYLSGDETEINEIRNLFSQTRPPSSEVSLITEEIGVDYKIVDYEPFLSKAIRSGNKDVVDHIRMQMSHRTAIASGVSLEGECIYFETDSGPSLDSIICISRLFPNVLFEMTRAFPDYLDDGCSEEIPVEDVFEFQNGNLLTDYSLRQLERGWELHIRKTTYEDVDDFKRYFCLSRHRNLKVEFIE